MWILQALIELAIFPLTTITTVTHYIRLALSPLALATTSVLLSSGAGIFYLGYFGAAYLQALRSRELFYSSYGLCMIAWWRRQMQVWFGGKDQDQGSELDSDTNYRQRLGHTYIVHIYKSSLCATQCAARHEWNEMKSNKTTSQWLVHS